MFTGAQTTLLTAAEHLQDYELDQEVADRILDIIAA
jgi:hypothetical protein